MLPLAGGDLLLAVAGLLAWLALALFTTSFILSGGRGR